MPEPVPHGTVEVLTRDDSGDRAIVAHLDAAQALALAFHQCRRDVARAGDGVERSGHHVSRQQGRLCDLARRGHQLGEEVVWVISDDHRRCSLRVAAAAELLQGSVGRKRRRAAARDQQHPALHCDSEEQRIPVGEVADAVRKRGGVLHPLAGARRGSHDAQTGHLALASVPDQLLEQLPLSRLQRTAQIAPELLLPGPEPQARRQAVHVARRGRGVGQRPRVFVYAECESGCVHGRDLDPSVQEQSEHRGREATVVGGDDALTGAVAVVVERDHLDVPALGDSEPAARDGVSRVLHEH